MFKREIVGRNLPWMATARFPDLTSQFASNLTESLNWTSWTLHRKLGWISWRRWIGTERNMRPWKGRLKLFLGRQRPIELRAVTAFPSPPPPPPAIFTLNRLENNRESKHGPRNISHEPGQILLNITSRESLGVQTLLRWFMGCCWRMLGGLFRDFGWISSFFFLLSSSIFSFPFFFFFFFLFFFWCLFCVNFCRCDWMGEASEGRRISWKAKMTPGRKILEKKERKEKDTQVSIRAANFIDFNCSISHFVCVCVCVCVCLFICRVRVSNLGSLRVEENPRNPIKNLWYWREVLRRWDGAEGKGNK